MPTKKYMADKAMFLTFLIRMSLSILMFAALVLFVVFAGEDIFEGGEAFSVVALYVLFGIGILLQILSVVFIYFRWKNFRFFIQEDSICTSVKFIFKHNVSLPFCKIHTINIKRGLLEIMLGASTLLIDSGSVNGSLNEQIKVTLKKGEVKRLFDYIESVSKRAKAGEAGFDGDLDQVIYDGNIGGEKVVGGQKICRMQVSSYFLAGITLSAFYGIVLFFFMMLGGVFGALYGENGYIDITALICSFLAAIPLAYICAAFYYLIKYYGYTVTRDEDIIHIKYGLLSQKDFSIAVDRINSVKLKQNPLTLLVRRYSLVISAIGFGATENEMSIPYLFIVSSKRFAKAMIREMLPEFCFDKPLEKARGKSWVHYFILSNMVLGIILVIAFALLIALWDGGRLYSIIGAVIAFAIIVCSSAICYVCTGVASDGDLLAIMTGGLFRTYHIVRNSSIQCVKRTQGFIRKAHKLARIKVMYRANLGNGNISIKHFNEQMFDRIAGENLEYN